MDRVQRLLNIKKSLEDFEKCLNEANGNLSIAFDKWLEEYRMLGVVQAIGYWVNDGWSEERVRAELQEMVKLIDEELKGVKVYDVVNMETSGQGVEVGEVLSCSDVVREEGRKTVKEVVRDYWGTLVFLLDSVVEDRLVEYEILGIVYRMVNKLKEEVEIREEVYAELDIKNDFWVMYEEGKVGIGYIERDEIVGRILVDCESEKILVMVEGEWGGYAWSVVMEVGRWILADFRFIVRLKPSPK